MTARVDAPDKQANALMKAEYASYFADPPKKPKAKGRGAGSRRGRRMRDKRRAA